MTLAEVNEVRANFLRRVLVVLFTIPLFLFGVGDGLDAFGPLREWLLTSNTIPMTLGKRYALGFARTLFHAM